jgi:hypothetical protein
MSGRRRAARVAGMGGDGHIDVATAMAATQVVDGRRPAEVLT